MKYWLDTEFIEDGHTIDLLSIGIVAEDGREFYAQDLSAPFTRASEWVARNVFTELAHFHPLGRRACIEATEHLPGLLDGATRPSRGGKCSLPDCPWLHRRDLQDALRVFCNPEIHGKPEIWGYYADYDWVVFCQLFGTMMDLPKGFPMYCRDLKQWCDQLDNPPLPGQGKGEHHALADARWNQAVYYFLESIVP